MNRIDLTFYSKWLGVCLILLVGLFAMQDAAPPTALGAVQTETTAFLPFITVPQARPPFYVSKSGNNNTGRSWAGAWNDFDQIDWSIIEPGDRIEVDGGAVSMTYTAGIRPKVSGTEEKPILIQLSSAAGRNGQVILFGGNQIPLPECGQKTWDESQYLTSGIAGIHLENGISNIHIDGRKRGGIVIHGWHQHGVKFYPDKIDNGRDDNPRNITLSYMEIYNNGGIERKNDGTTQDLYYPLNSGAGIKLAGSGHEFRFLEVHDNAADAIQSAFTSPADGVFNNMDNLTVTDSWFYNQRPHSGQDNSPASQICTPRDRTGCDELGAPHMANDYHDYPAEPANRRESFNWCTHSDGIQIFSSNDFNTLRIDRTIIGPNFMNALILGDQNNENETAWVNNLTLRDVVLTRYMHNALGMNTPPESAGRNWVLSNVTMYGHFSNTKKDTLSIDSNIEGTDHRIINSIMVHGRTEFPPTNVALINNCEFGLYSGSVGGADIDPQFKHVMAGDIFEEDLSVDFATVFLDDYTAQAPFCQPLGSKIHSVAELLANFSQVE